MFPEDQNLDSTQSPAAVEQQQPPSEPTPDDVAPAPEPPKKKRNCGRTGPTTPQGKFNSSQNARKHGACARTLILPVESEQGWLILLSRFTDEYQPRQESLEYDFVLRTAQAEWFRLRTHRQYDEFLISTGGAPPHKWTPDQIKTHDLMLRYCGVAQRAFHREQHALEAYYKIHKLRPTPPPPPPPPDEEPKPIPEAYVYEASDEEIRQIIQEENNPTASPNNLSEPFFSNKEVPPKILRVGAGS